MARYFLELAYKGTNYAGFQVQQNAVTIQSEVEKAMHIYFRQAIELTGSSRTDKGVHARQNFFHFDAEFEGENAWPHHVYHLNAILPSDIVIRSIRQVDGGAHARFDAKSRTYEYSIYRFKNPFLADMAYFFPYHLQWDKLNEAASILGSNTYFKAFSKHHTQVKTFDCSIIESGWHDRGDVWVYKVKGNRFLRGMVRGMVGTMLRVGRGKLTVEDLHSIIEAGESSGVDFSVPAHGLTLVEVAYSEKTP